MPHLTLEYSDGIDQTHDMQKLCEALFDALLAHPATATREALKIRAQSAPYSVSGAPVAGQVHATLWLLPGRDAETKSSLTALICDVLSDTLHDVGAVCVDVQELNAAYTKRVL